MSAPPILLSVPVSSGGTQYNWITESFDCPPAEQLSLDLRQDPELLLPEDDKVSLVATESGSQLMVSGFGLWLGKKSERLVVRHEGKICAQVPFLRLQEVVIGSRGVSVSSDLIEELCARGIRISLLSSGGRPFALLTSPLLNATVQTRQAQFLARESSVGSELARMFVLGKLRNQERLLRYFARTREGDREASLLKAAASLRSLRKSVSSVQGGSAEAVRGSLFGLEGAGARLYWSQFASLLPEGCFSGRDQSGTGGPVNSALNYGYGILTAHIWGAVLNAGLEPFAGFLHVDRSGKPSLALDLMEEFRQPVVDRSIFAWLLKGGQLRTKGGMLDGQSREEVAARVLARLSSREVHRGKEFEIRSIIQIQARTVASAVRGTRQYQPFAFRW